MKNKVKNLAGIGVAAAILVMSFGVHNPGIVETLSASVSEAFVSRHAEALLRPVNPTAAIDLRESKWRKGAPLPGDENKGGRAPSGDVMV